MGTSVDDAIRQIVKKVPRGCIFDSHFVLSQLIRLFSDEYLSFAGKFARSGKQPTLPTHGQIGRKINRLGKTVVQRIGPAWSENIHKRPSRCTCWKALSGRPIRERYGYTSLLCLRAAIQSS